MTPVEIHRGDSPVVLGMPHTGLNVPEAVFERFNDRGRQLADTDWHIHKLYEALLPGATTVRATFHRYVIDANRDPAGVSLYPGQNTTGLCPLTDFQGESIYREGMAPDQNETEDRRADYHVVYHAALEAELTRVHKIHGIAVLYDCHSIRSRIPYLFEGRLPDFNVGTNAGETCAPEIEQAVFSQCKNASEFKSVLNGRFKGGWTTRRYGRPDRNMHAIQMELVQENYMQEEAPWTYLPEKAGKIRPLLASVLKSIEDLALGGSLQTLHD